ncbi:MspA protein [Mycobacterium sp. 852002-51971_SCH5477799-a]|uniref:MspA family porin n=1 Tax=Mycobacterium sp. 852002-51971_SCH5477799-a TaxID=1834106 RepID=UPI00080021C9|nr:MspA family porin [Mycobacterium sp. 852002-51971_SCH5477799-a]OBF66964.1 MspA protein [Mycobacterium sp. 852002-51971_SCH5477799-a]
MVIRRALAAAVCLAVSLPTAPATGADPDAEPPPPEAAPVAEGSLPSNPPVVLQTPDGWTLGVGARDEQQVPVAPLTTAVSSREYLASGIFVGSLVGPGKPQGVLEVGFEIGCGIDMSTSDGVTIGGTAGITPGVTGPVTGVPGDVLPLVVAPIAGVLNVGLKPGLVVVVPVVKKQFRGPNPWVMVSNFHVKIDGCVGQSFIRSYAVLNRVTDDSDVVLSYVGVTKTV